MLKNGKLHPHPLGQTELPTFQHNNNKNLIENYTFELSWFGEGFNLTFAWPLFGDLEEEVTKCIVELGRGECQAGGQVVDLGFA